MTTRVTPMRPLAAAASLALLFAACTTEEASNPGPTLTTVASTTSTTAAPPTSTTVAPTTVEPVESTTTPPTTLADGPTEALVPLFIGGAGGAGWLFLGAWQQDRWQSSTDPSGNPIRPGGEAGTSFTVSNLDGETPVVLGENTEACFDDRVGPSIDVEVAEPDPPGFGYNAVAVITQPWALKPRPVAVTSTAPDAYRTLGVEAFAEEPVDATQGAIGQLVVADLDGDGDDEALVAFEFVQPGIGVGVPGDLAALLAIDVQTRATETILLSTVDQDAEDDGTFGLIERYRVLDVADLNGDGRMEVLVHAWYYEGAAVLVYSYDGTGFTEVLATGCGA